MIAWTTIPSSRGVSEGTGVPFIRNRNAFGSRPMERKASPKVPSAAISVFFPYIEITTLTPTYRGI